MIYTQLIIWYQNTISSISTSYPSLHIYQIPDTRYQIPDTIHHRYNILHHRYNIYYLSNTHVFITPMPIATRTIKYYSAVRSTIPLSQCLFTVDKLMLNFLAVCDWLNPCNFNCLIFLLWILPSFLPGFLLIFRILMSGIFPLISVGKIIPVSTTGISSPSGNYDKVKKQILI